MSALQPCTSLKDGTSDPITADSNHVACRNCNGVLSPEAEIPTVPSGKRVLKRCITNGSLNLLSALSSSSEAHNNAGESFPSDLGGKFKHSSRISGSDNSISDTYNEFASSAEDLRKQPSEFGSCFDFYGSDESIFTNTQTVYESSRNVSSYSNEQITSVWDTQSMYTMSSIFPETLGVRPQCIGKEASPKKFSRSYTSPNLLGGTSSTCIIPDVSAKNTMKSHFVGTTPPSCVIDPTIYMIKKPANNSVQSTCCDSVYETELSSLYEEQFESALDSHGHCKPTIGRMHSTFSLDTCSDFLSCTESTTSLYSEDYDVTDFESTSQNDSKCNFLKSSFASKSHSCCTLPFRDNSQNMFRPVIEPISFADDSSSSSTCSQEPKYRSVKGRRPTRYHYGKHCTDRVPSPHHVKSNLHQSTRTADSDATDFLRRPLASKGVKTNSKQNKRGLMKRLKQMGRFLNKIRNRKSTKAEVETQAVV